MMRSITAIGSVAVRFCTGHRLMAIPRRYASYIFALLVVLLTIGESHSQVASPETLATTASIENQRNKALFRIDHLILEINATERQKLEERYRSHVNGLLKPVEQAIEAVQIEINNNVGAWDALSSSSRERKLRHAFEAAKVQEAVTKLVERLQDDIADQSSRIYTERFAQLNLVLREEIANPLGPRAGDVVFQDLSARLKQAAVSRLEHMEAPDGVDVDKSGLSVTALSGAALIAIRRLVMSRIGKQLARRIGGSLLGRALGKAATAFAASPGKTTGYGIVIDVAIGIGTLLITIADAGQQTRDAMNQRVADWYTTEIVEPLSDERTVDAVVTGIIESVEQELRNDRDVANQLIDDTYRGFMAQTKSPGFDEFVARSSDATLSTSGFKVSSIFGADFVEVDYSIKLDVARRISQSDKARHLVHEYGHSFIDLFARDPESTSIVAKNSDVERSFHHIMHTEKPLEELLTFRRSIARFGALDAPQTAALVLSRTLLPTRPVEQIQADGLARVAASVGPLETLATIDNATTDRIVGWLLDGSLSHQTLERILNRPSTPALAKLLVAVEPQSFDTLLGVSDADQLSSYLRDVPAEQAAVILRQDGPGSLRFYQLSEGGGRRAVIAREQVRQEAGQMDFEMEGTLRWLLARTDLPGISIDLPLVRNLQAIRLPGVMWPDTVAVPVAKFIASVGLAFPLAAIGFLIAAPLLAWWTRLFPRRRQQRPPQSVAVSSSAPDATAGIQGGSSKPSGGQLPGR